MGDFGDRGLEQGMCGGQALIVQNVAPAHHGAEPHAVGGNLDLAQIDKLAQIDQQRRLRQPERQHRDEALAACEQLGIAVARGKQRHRLGQRGRTCIFERRHFHGVHQLSSRGRGGQTNRARRVCECSDGRIVIRCLA